MESNFGARKSKRRKKTDFDPNHDFVDEAVKEFLENGGEIKKVEALEKNYQGFLAGKEPVSPADEFLMEN